MKKLLSVLSSTLQGGVRGGLLFVALLATTSLWAEDFSVGGIYYNYLDGNNVEVTYRGSRYDSYSNEYSGSVEIPATVYVYGTTYNVTSIGEDAFFDCHSLTSITISNSVTSIGSSAFYDCSSLTSINIPNSVTSIGSYSFYYCESLTSITIPNSVTSIGDWAFSGCSSISSVTIPKSVISIGDYAFLHCTSLTSITIPESVINIGEKAFENCQSLTSITVGKGVTSIGERAFAYCSSLASIVVEADNTTYDSRNDCNAIIETVTNTLILGCQNTIIPNSVTSIGKMAFCFCFDLSSVTIPNSVTNIGNSAFNGCSSLTSITIPNSVTSIGDWAFSGCSSLTSVTIPESVTSIGDYAFSYCSALTSVTIPNNVTSIGGWAFDGCSSLNEVILGTGLKTIDEYAFQGCTKLYDVYCYAAEPPTTSESSFENYNAFLHVPCESQRLYLLDINFGNFKYIECVSSDEVSTDGVVVTPSTNDVTIIWPTETGADSYTIVIQKGNEVFCTLTFNADGQLLNIAFAPSRDGNNRPVQYAEQAVNGYRFTVTGLEEGTHYAYNIDVRDAANKTIKSHTGEFTTESMTAVENTQHQSLTSDCQKILRDGQLLILRDDKTYNIVGQIVE